MNLTIAAEHGLTSWTQNLVDQRNHRQDEQARAEADFAYEFVKAIEAGNPDATPDWTGTVPDYNAGHNLGMSSASPGFPRRRCTVDEAFRDGLDYTGGPDMRDVVKVLSIAMSSPDPIVALAARQLVKRAADVYSSHNCPEVA